MPDSGGTGRGPDPGLCGSCRHARVVRSDRGSRFYLCRRSRSDARFPRYPGLPVIRCPGYQASEPGGSGPAREGETAERGLAPEGESRDDA